MKFTFLMNCFGYFPVKNGYLLLNDESTPLLKEAETK